MLRRRTLALVSLLLFAAALPAVAQSSPGVEGRLVLGLTRQGGIFGDDSPRSSQRIGLTIGGQFRRHPERRAGLVLDLAFQPIPIRNPHFDERLQVMYVHIAPEIGRTVYVRPGGGVAVHLWSGRDAASSLRIAPSVGVAGGVRRTLGSGVRIGGEVILRTSFEPGALAWVAGAQVPVSWGAR